MALLRGKVDCEVRDEFPGMAEALAASREEAGMLPEEQEGEIAVEDSPPNDFSQSSNAKAMKAMLDKVPEVKDARDVVKLLDAEEKRQKFKLLRKRSSAGMIYCYNICLENILVRLT